MEVGIYCSNRITKVSVNSCKPVVSFTLPKEEASGTSSAEFERTEEARLLDRGIFSEDRKIFSSENLEIRERDEGIEFRLPLGVRDHVLGFGEKAFDVDRRRTIFRMWGRDPGGYRRGDDPIYLTVPFFIRVSQKVRGYFLNCASSTDIDVGVSLYANITVSTGEREAELYIFEGRDIEEIVELYTSLTGKPFRLPRWALGHQVSRYSYFPEGAVMDVLKEYRGIPVSAIYLDIDYMQGYRVFTWDRERFPDPERTVEKIHAQGIKVVTIIDPGIKMDQHYDVFGEFVRGKGFVETPDGELFHGKVWPGECAFPDFLSGEGRNIWKKMMKNFVERSGVDGIWLDMNEPSIFNETRTIDGAALHSSSGGRLKHSHAHNAYAYFQAMATFEALSETGREPFILTRSGFSGIQKYCAVWTGDNASSWDDIRLQISMVTSLGLSGIPYAGCDIGGFFGRADPELISRYYCAAAFFPFFRNHKSKDGNDQEIFQLPRKYRLIAEEAVKLRYSFMPYLEVLADEAHHTGHPMVRPLCYDFLRDENTYSINDQYMVGPSLMYAPVIEKGTERRALYLPEGLWCSFPDFNMFRGGDWIEGEGMPLYIRQNSLIPMAGGQLLVFGKGKLDLHDGRKSHIEFDGNTLISGAGTGFSTVLFLGDERKSAEVDGRKLKAESFSGGTKVSTAGFRKITLL